jgi:hypothetical protein
MKILLNVAIPTDVRKNAINVRCLLNSMFTSKKLDELYELVAVEEVRDDRLHYISPQNRKLEEQRIQIAGWLTVAPSGARGITFKSATGSVFRASLAWRG